MKAADADFLWAFKPRLTDDSEVLCPTCRQWSPFSGWTEGTTYCEECDEHATIVCPLCEAGHDHVWAKAFQTREA